jgi:hypothetical protein
MFKNYEIVSAILFIPWVILSKQEVAAAPVTSTFSSLSLF